MDYFDVIARRESCREYTDARVEREKLIRCLEAARIAPSACNSQPWSFVVIEDGEKAKQVAKHVQGAGMNRFAEGCGCFVTVVEEKGNISARLGARMKDQDYSSLDIGLACAHFCLAATAQSLSTCMLGWFDEKKLKAALDIPEEKRVRLVICVGYAKTETLRAKSRKSLDEITRFV